MYLGIEGGGTTFVCGSGTDPDDLHAVTTIPTTTPDQTLAALDDWVGARLADGPAPAAIGVATFGPLDLDEHSPDHGRITATPKPGWRGTDLPGHLQDRFGLPVAIDTDVTGAAVAEARWGALQGAATGVYLAVGTGVGGGLVVEGRPPRGLIHPEMGHLRVQRHDRDDFPGSCPFHGGDCVEGLASGTAVRGRFGRSGHELDGDELELARTLLGDYLGQVVASITLVCSPRRIVLGGGVARMEGLLEVVRNRAVAELDGAMPHPRILEGATDYVVTPGLGDHAGLLGALALADDVARGDRLSVTDIRSTA